MTCVGRSCSAMEARWFPQLVDGASDRVEERGAVARNVCVAVEGKDLGHRQGARRHEVIVVKKGQGSVWPVPRLSAVRPRIG